MCGVVAVWSYQPGGGAIDQREVDTIRDSMSRRGPDGAGTWVGDQARLALAHRRLAIIGLGEQGHQPMVLDSLCRGGTGPLAVSYNGEIYNHQALRRELETGGHHFSGSSDTEVLLHLYEEEGIAIVDRLRGMFAFALWDGAARQLHLARDPLGIKPLYFADDGATIRVASQARALLESPAVAKSTDDAALAGFLVFGSIPEPRTAWTSIRALGAGSTMTIDATGNHRSQRYFSLSRLLADAETAAAFDATEAPASMFAETAQAHLVADVDVGVFLSAGIDSASLLGLASAGGRQMHAVTLGFDEFSGAADDEVPLARLVADRYDALHDVRRVSHHDFAAWLTSILSDMDQPSIDGLNTWMVAHAAASSGLKVALSGIGGDEFLAGYPTFQSVPALVRRLGAVASVPRIGPSLRQVAYPLVRSRSPKLAGVVEYADTLAHAWLLRRAVLMPWELSGVLGAERAEAALTALDIDGVLDDALRDGPRGPTATVAALEGGLYLRNQLLRDADWAGMAHSLEIRVPLTDIRLVSAVAPLLARHWTPPAGKQALAGAPNPALPPEVASRPKTGFSVPMAQWATMLPDHDRWRSVPTLAHPACRWARRWAYTVADSFAMIGP